MTIHLTISCKNAFWLNIFFLKVPPLRKICLSIRAIKCKELNIVNGVVATIVELRHGNVFVHAEVGKLQCILFYYIMHQL